MGDTFTFAMIGHGMVAGTHLAAIADSAQELRLGSVVGRDKDRAAAFAATASAQLGYEVPALVDPAAAAREADAALILTPPDARDAAVEAFVSVGKPILMEKPVERTLDAAAALVQRCETANVPLGMVLQHRARDATVALRDAVAAGRLGDIATVELRVPWWRDQAYYDVPGRGTYDRDGGGVMLTQAIHALDSMLWCLGPVRSVQALMRTTPLHRLEAEDWAGALFEMENGAAGVSMATTAAHPGGAESLHVQGTKAAAHLEGGALTVSPFDGEPETIGAAAATGGGADPMGFTHAWHQAILKDFARAVRSGEPPLATGRSALKAHAVIAAMEASSLSGRREEVQRV